MNSLSGNLFISVSLIFRDFLCFQLKVIPLPFHFGFTFSAFMNLGETLTSCDLKRVILCGSVSYRLRVPKAFEGKTRFGRVQFTFLESVLQLTLVGDRTEMALELMFAVRLTAQWPSLLLGKWGLTSLLEQKPGGSTQAGSVSLSVCFLLSPHKDLC